MSRALKNIQKIKDAHSKGLISSGIYEKDIITLLCGTTCWAKYLDMFLGVVSPNTMSEFYLDTIDTCTYDEFLECSDYTPEELIQIEHVFEQRHPSPINIKAYRSSPTILNIKKDNIGYFIDPDNATPLEHRLKNVYTLLESLN